MQPNKTDILIVLDRSGSMAEIRDDTIGGFNVFLKEQKTVPGEATITLAQFDDIYEVIYDAVPIANAQELTNKTYVPRNSTALYDAICKTIDNAGKRLSDTIESRRPAHVICAIITDGKENASTKFSSQDVNERITRQRDQYKWEFVFIGANQDAIVSARALGIPTANAINYTDNKIGTDAVYSAMSDNVRGMRMSAKASMSWEPKQRKDQEDAKAKK